MSKKKEKKAPKEDTDFLSKTVSLDGLYKNWFLDYASYVILERAIPRIEDGLKPVQRRIAHAIKEMDDGRFNKVANVIGQTMQYHPHGDAAIGAAMVNLGQKGLLLETQGNWGDIRTGDGAAAPRYIEARLSKFALEVVYNTQTTEWQLSYDGRKKEPVTLPIKFPLLLLQGVEGIAVGLSTKILPHNFSEIIAASIAILKGKSPKIYPDFPTGGYADFSEYNQGLRGGKVKIRAKIDIIDKKTLAIKEIPYGTTTNSLMESIVKANEKGKIKLKQIVDNTAREVDILIHMQAGQPPEIAVDALYAFTDCEISISTNACVIVDNKPCFMQVNAMLQHNVEQTVALLKRELEIKQAELMEKILFSSLEKIFIEKRIYRNIESCETFDAVLETIDQGLKPYKKQFYRTVEKDDIIRLTEIRIKRISKYDSFKADDWLKSREKELKETQHSLKNLTQYAITYYENLLTTYGKGRERKTIIKNFQSVTAHEVIANNQKLYVNRADGFLGWGLKKDEYLGECSEIDDVIVIRKDGKAMVSRIAEKVFMGKHILHAGVWKKGDERMVYNMVYTDGKTGKSFIKRFAIPAVVRDKEYNLTQDTPNSKIHYFSANPNGEAELIEVKLSSSCTARKKIFEFDFSMLEIKGKGSKGNTLTRYPIRKIELLQKGSSTLGGVELWFDFVSGRLNKDTRGQYIGRFDGEDRILSITKSGTYKLSNFDLSTRFEPDEKTLLIEKFDAKKTILAVYREGKSKQHFVKKFKIETQTEDREFEFIPTSSGSRLEYIDAVGHVHVEVTIIKNKKSEKQSVDLSKIVDTKGWKAVGNRLSPYKVTAIKPLEKSSSQKMDTVKNKKKPTSKKEGKADTLKKQKNKKISGKNFQAGDTIELDF